MTSSILGNLYRAENVQKEDKVLASDYYISVNLDLKIVGID